MFYISVKCAVDSVKDAVVESVKDAVVDSVKDAVWIQ